MPQERRTARPPTAAARRRLGGYLARQRQDASAIERRLEPQAHQDCAEVRPLEGWGRIELAAVEQLLQLRRRRIIQGPRAGERASSGGEEGKVGETIPKACVLPAQHWQLLEHRQDDVLADLLVEVGQAREDGMHIELS